MDWFRTDVDWPRDPKILKAGPDGALLFFAALAYTAEQETDGRIPKDVVPILVPRVLVTRPDRSAKTLTRVGLWREDGDDFVIDNFTKKNPTHAKMVADRKAAEGARETERQRKAAWRARKSGVPANVPGDVPQDVPPDVPRDSPGDGDVPVPPDVPPLDTGRYGTGRNDLDPGSDSDVGLDLERGSGGKPDVFEDDQVRAKFGDVLTSDQLHNFARLCSVNRGFFDIWPPTFNAHSKKVVTEALTRARDRDVIDVTRPRSWIESLMAEVAAELNGSGHERGREGTTKRSRNRPRS